MSFDEAVRPRLPAHYEGEDASVTTPRELNGWYSYAIAAEVFAVVGVGIYARYSSWSLQKIWLNKYQGSFLPVTLEQLARERGVFFSNRSKPCIGSSGNASRLHVRVDENKEEQCIVRFLGSDMTTASFAMYTFSAAVLVQAITLVCFSSFADHGMPFYLMTNTCRYDRRCS